MNKLFKSMLRKGVLVFFYDILVYSNSLEEHCKHLRRVLEILKEQKLFANRKKCEFGRAALEYLGHIISSKGVAADPEKILAMQSWPTPKNLEELRGFLGLTGYYRKFVEGYGKLAEPLTRQLKRDSFNLDSEANLAFRRLKDAMTKVSILALPDFSLPFVVETYALGVGLGALLSQRQRPIAFFSQALSAKARLKSIYERELMGVVLAVQKWRHYLLGRHFIVYTDQKS